MPEEAWGNPFRSLVIMNHSLYRLGHCVEQGLPFRASNIQDSEHLAAVAECRCTELKRNNEVAILKLGSGYLLSFEFGG